MLERCETQWCPPQFAQRCHWSPRTRLGNICFKYLPIDQLTFLENRKFIGNVHFLKWTKAKY
jgi:hypothetical protein